MSRIKRKTDIEKFILDYIEENQCTDMTDTKFNEEFFNRFGGSRKETFWGSQPNRLAAKYLKSLYDQGILDREIIPLGFNWQPGFPKWVYGYAKRGYFDGH